MRKLIAILAAVVMACAFTPLAGASDEAIINVTLSPSATVSIVCNRSVWSSTAALGTNESTAVNWASLTNDGNVAVLVNVTSEDTENWQLESTAAHDQFSMRTIGIAVTLTELPQTFIASLEPPGDGGSPVEYFGLQVFMPTTSSTADEQHFAITFEATAL